MREIFFILQEVAMPQLVIASTQMNFIITIVIIIIILLLLNRNVS